MMFDTKTVSFVRETCNELLRTLDLVEAARDNRALCHAINKKLKLNPNESPRTGDIYRVILDVADEAVHDLAFTLLMVAMGETIPNSRYCYHDYSILYGNLGDKGDAWDDE